MQVRLIGTKGAQRRRRLKNRKGTGGESLALPGKALLPPGRGSRHGLLRRRGNGGQGAGDLGAAPRGPGQVAFRRQLLVDRQHGPPRDALLSGEFAARRQALPRLDPS